MGKQRDYDEEKKALGIRIEAVINHYQLTKLEFSIKAEISPASLSNTIQGKSTGSFVFLHNIIHAFPDINARWLLTGQGQMLSESIEKVKPMNDKSDQHLSQLSEENNKLNKQIRYLIQFIQLNNNGNEKNFSISV